MLNMGKAKPVPFRCDACRLVLLSTDDLGAISREELHEALEAGDAEATEGELYRHQTLRERWSLAIQARRIREREAKRRARRRG